MNDYAYFVGMDIAKTTVDFCLFDGLNYHSFTIDNNVKVIKSLFLKSEVLKAIDWKRTLFCMEHTGIYNHSVLAFLDDSKANIWLENPLHIKRSMGLIRGKSDKLDAKRIVQFACRNQDQVKLWKPQRPAIKQLRHLLAARARLIKAVNMLKVPIAELKPAITKAEYKQLTASCSASIKRLQTDIKKTGKLVKEILHADEYLQLLFTRITSVECVGPVTAVSIIVTTNEFKSFDNAKKFACYAGLAPFEYSSGTSVRGKTRISHMANKDLKKLLHMAALAAIRTSGSLQDYYLRKVKEGKNKMLVINAVRNKLVARIFACIKHEKLYTKQYNVAA